MHFVNQSTFNNIKSLIMKSSLFVSHLAAAIIISGIILFIYAGVQQVHRSMANDPQLQLARDLRDAVANGKSTAHLIPPDTINLDKSDAVFTVVYNSAGMPLQTTALLGNKVPQIPKGVMEFTNQYLEDAVT